MSTSAPNAEILAEALRIIIAESETQKSHINVLLEQMATLQQQNNELRAEIRHGLGAESLKIAFEGIFQFALSSVKSLFFMNGGAIIAILALIGTILTKVDNITSQTIKDILYGTNFHIWGITLASSVSMLSYVAQYAYIHSQHGSGREQKICIWLAIPTHILAIVSAITSAGFFIYGSLHIGKVIAEKLFP